jgi:hypothetical protein
MLSPWMLIWALAVLDFFWLPVAGLTVTARSVLIVVAATALLGGIAFVYERLRPDKRIATSARVGSELIAYCAVGAVLSYLTVTLRAPLVDQELVALDRSMGLDWLATARWLGAHPGVNFVLEVAYDSLIVQIVGLILLLPGIGMAHRSHELLWSFILTSLICILVSAAWPAGGAFVQYQTNVTTPYVQHFIGIRDGTMKVLDLQQVQGIIQFPSFHVALAMILTYAVRGIRYLFPALLTINVLVVLATPVIGGHHFADVFAGGILTAITLFLMHRSDRFRKEVERPPLPG